MGDPYRSSPQLTNVIWQGTVGTDEGEYAVTHESRALNVWHRTGEGPWREVEYVDKAPVFMVWAIQEQVARKDAEEQIIQAGFGKMTAADLRQYVVSTILPRRGRTQNGKGSDEREA